MNLLPAIRYESERRHNQGAAIVIETESTGVRKTWPDYRAVWRWHFYAGVVSIPFIVILAISGSIYLFKPQLEAWLERGYDNLVVKSSALKPASAQISAALKAVPGSSFQSYEIPSRPTDSGRVLLNNQQGEAIRVYVHPESLEVLGSIPERERFMKVLFRIHGELLMGNRGSNLVELASSWAIMMILSGLFLWWPRKAKGLGGILYPRLGSGSKIFWRDIHGVTGFWISGLALFLLLSGLPWAKFWGDYLKKARAITGTAVVRQDWTNGAEPKPASAGEDHSGHSGKSSRRGNRNKGPVDLAALDRVVASVLPLTLLPPVVIAPPSQGSTNWSAKSMTPNRPQRVDLTIDGATGEIKDRKDFSSKPLIDRIVGTGIAAHEGQLFGWPNQLLGLLTAMGLVLLSLSSVVMWWKRREPGELGAPSPAAKARFSFGLLLIVLFLGIYLPLFGISLVAMLILEKLLLKRIPPVQRWLGLQPPGSRKIADSAMA
jgi:uncharacterized iron-regulated membrane protein